jgi:hypothetical protein
MFRLAAFLAVAIPSAVTAGFAAGVFIPSLLPAPDPAPDEAAPPLAAEVAAPTIADSVDRSGKGDRLEPARATGDQANKITVVEVVGVRDTAVVYRDRQGRVLFRTDPVANVTVVAKGSVLPQVTIRESAEAVVKPAPVEAPASSVSPELAQGCEPVLSPQIAPSYSHLVGRCLAQAKTKARYAAVNR